MENEEMNQEDQPNTTEDEDPMVNYQNWKRNSPFLYDTLITHELENISLCVNWFPKKDYSKELYNVQKLILGTYSEGVNKDYLIIAKIFLPNLNLKRNNKDIKDYDNEVIKEYSKIKNKIEIETKIRHEGEINKAKIMPQIENKQLIATKKNNGELNIYDYLKFSNEKNNDDEIPNPTKILKGQTKIGYGISWNNIEEGLLVSSSYDHSICLWDINSDKNDPLKKYNEHTLECEDVCFSKKNCNLFLSCGDDKTIKIFDKRADKSMNSIEGHSDFINSIDINSINEFLYITGSKDNTIALWDLRKPELKLHSFLHHKEAITNVRWNPKIENIFASAGEDCKILIWDLFQIGANIGRDDNDDACSEMIFEHSGHLDRINDIDWNLLENMMIGSVDNAKILHLWEMNEQINKK